MKAMILAAGLGTRLRPLTLELAKPAIPILGEPLIIRLIRRLAEEGVNAFRVNLHHLPHTIERLFFGSEWEQQVSFSHESKILGTAGGLKANESFFDSTFLMANADIVFDFPLEAAIRFHKENHALATLVLVRQLPPFRFYPIRIDDQFRFRQFKGEWPGSSILPDTYLFTGVHIIEPEIFDLIPPARYSEINDDIYYEALKRGARVLAFPVEGFWSDLGDPARYLATQRDLFSASGAAKMMISASTRLENSVKIDDFVSVGSHCILEDGVSVANSIILDDVHLTEDVTVNGCIVGSGIRVKGGIHNRVITRYGEAPIVW
jgi:NDP-sugar pyrophosphorylase family protein